MGYFGVCASWLADMGPGPEDEGPKSDYELPGSRESPERGYRERLERLGFEESSKSRELVLQILQKSGGPLTQTTPTRGPVIEKFKKPLFSLIRRESSKIRVF